MNARPQCSVGRFSIFAHIMARACRKPKALTSTCSLIRHERLRGAIVDSFFEVPFASHALNYELARQGAELGRAMHSRCLPMFAFCEALLCAPSREMIEVRAANAYHLGRAMVPRPRRWGQ